MTIHFQWFVPERIIREIRTSRTNVGNGHFRTCDDLYFRFRECVLISTRLMRTVTRTSSKPPSFLSTSSVRRPPRSRCSPASSTSFAGFETKFSPENKQIKLLYRAVFFNLGSAEPRGEASHSSLGSVRILKLVLFWVFFRQTLNNVSKALQLEKGWKTLV